MKVLRAARGLFASAGYQQTTIGSIARRANVAEPTVYAAFKSKAGILAALVASAGGDPDIRAAAGRAMARRDPKLRLNGAAHVIRLILEREGDITELLWQAGSGDPHLRDAWRQSHDQQLRRQAEVLRPLAAAKAFRPGITLGGALDTFWALSSPEVYRLLVRERGWSPARYERWLAASASALLLG